MNFGRVVAAGESYRGKQGPAFTPGVSAETVGSLKLWLGSVVLQPGGRTKAHVHNNHESAFYQVSRDAVELWMGHTWRTSQSPTRATICTFRPAYRTWRSTGAPPPLSSWVHAQTPTNRRA
jgi:uncharacterized RmlC-like cupin family protein